MKKLILAAFVMMGVSVAVSAQSEKKFSLSVGPELGFATGSFNNTHSIGIGGTVQAEVYLMDKLKGTATFGLQTYIGRSIPLTTNADYAAQRIMPLRVGAKYFLSGGLYGGAQLGVAFLGNFATGTSFAYSPLMIGYEFKTKSDKAIDATIKYDAYTGSNGIGTMGTFGIRIAYVL